MAQELKPGAASLVELEKQVLELRQQVLQLKLENTKYKSLFELSGDALSILDLETGKFIECNDAAVSMHGVENRTNFLHLTPDQLSPEFQPNGLPSKDLAIERITKTFTEGPQVFEWVHSRLDGTTFPCLVSLSAIPLEEHQLVLAIRRDISTLIETQEALKQAKLNAEEASKAKSDFLSNMSHERRTPLNSVIGFSQILKRSSNLQQDERNMVGNITRSGEHLLGLINDVLDIAKIESGKTVIESNVVDLKAFIYDIRQMFINQMKDKYLDYRLIDTDDLPEFIVMDMRKVKQIIINLVSNAYKFTDKGSVLVKFSYVNNVLEVKVLDTGSGVSENEIDLLFEAFSQTESGISSQQGTGLGLPISRKFARLMGGDLQVSSQRGLGSEFCLTIPACISEITPETNNNDQSFSLKPNQKKCRILIVDDNETNRLVLTTFLTSLGLEVATAGDGEQAIEVTRTIVPDLTFMDLQMPKLCGHQATKAIKNEFPKGRIVILTASVLQRDAIEKMPSQADAILFKPYDELKIIRTLEQLLGLEFELRKVEPVTDSSCLNGEELTGDAVNNILLVDDQDINRVIAKRALNHLGMEAVLSKPFIQDEIDKLLMPVVKEYPSKTV